MRYTLCVPIILLLSTSLAFAQASSDAVATVRASQSPSPGGGGKPRAVLTSGEDFSLAIRGFTQLQGVPWVGEDALLSNGDVADFPGLRVRRLSIGLEGRVGKRLSFDVWMDLAEGPILDQARLAWTFFPELTVEAGVVKVPFSRSAIQSSAEILFTERPLSVHGLVPDRQPGIALYGALFDGIASYRAGVFNGASTSRAALGNDHPGALYALRVGVTPLGAPRPGQSDLERGPFRFELAGNALYDQAASFDGFAFGGDLTLQGYGATVLVKYVDQTRTPVSEPVMAPSILDHTRRTGLIAQAGYVVPKIPLELAVRWERADDNVALEDVGDTDGTAFGVRYHLPDYGLRFDLDWYRRIERHGREMKNDAVVLTAQGRF